MLLAQLLRGSDASQVLVFTKTKIAAGRLARQLQKEGVAAYAIHGDKTQLERIQALEAFKHGSVTVLIGTDVARVAYIDQLPMVINYEIPHAPEDYVHRIGRTGRAGAFGKAISLVSPEEEKYLKENPEAHQERNRKGNGGRAADARAAVHGPRRANIMAMGHATNTKSGAAHREANMRNEAIPVLPHQKNPAMIRGSTSPTNPAARP